MAIRVRPSPWAAAGGLSEGLAEGLYMGQNLALQRQQMDAHKFNQALQILAQGAKLSEDQPEMGQLLLNAAKQASPQLAGLQIPQARAGGPWGGKLERARQRVAALKALNPALDEQELLMQELGYKDQKSPWKPTPAMMVAAKAAGIDPQALMNLNLTQEQAAKLEQGLARQQGLVAGAKAEAVQPFKIEIAGMRGGGRGGGGRPKKSDIVNWYNAQGQLVGQARYDQPPPGATTFANISSKGPGGEGETPLTPSDFAKAIEFQKVVEDPSAPPIHKMIAKKGLEQIGIGQIVNPSYGPGMTPVPVTKPKKVKPGAAKAPPPPPPGTKVVEE